MGEIIKGDFPHVTGEPVLDDKDGPTGEVVRLDGLRTKRPPTQYGEIETLQRTKTQKATQESTNTLLKLFTKIRNKKVEDVAKYNPFDDDSPPAA
jgi:hypothetical protein